MNILTASPRKLRKLARSLPPLTEEQRERYEANARIFSKVSTVPCDEVCRAMEQIAHFCRKANGEQV